MYDGCSENTYISATYNETISIWFCVTNQKLSCFQKSQMVMKTKIYNKTHVSVIAIDKHMNVQVRKSVFNNIIREIVVSTKLWCAEKRKGMMYSQTYHQNL